MVEFVLRDEKGLHCKFCNWDKDKFFPGVKLFETSPVKGIVCSECRKRLEAYLDGVIDLRCVRLSIVVEGRVKSKINEVISDEFGFGFELKKNHHVLIVDLGER